MLLAMTDGNKKERKIQLHQVMADSNTVEYKEIAWVMKKKNGLTQTHSWKRQEYFHSLFRKLEKFSFDTISKLNKFYSFL